MGGSGAAGGPDGAAPDRADADGPDADGADAGGADVGGSDADGAGSRRWPRVDVVLLGWRAAPTTCAALAAVAGCGYPSLRMVVVDNGSDDGAAEVVWAELRRLRPGAVRLAHDAVEGPTGGPTAGAGGASGAGGAGGRPDGVLVTCPRNRGYAGGMNVGLAYVRAVQPGDHFLLLNNDVLVGPGTLEALVERCEADPAVGLCGPTQLVLDERGEVSSTVPCGIRYHPVIGFPSRIDVGVDGGREPQPAEVERQMYGVLGGAVFGTAAYLEATGPLDAGSFIYYEEMELARRARKAGFRVGWAPAATVSNVHGTTMQTNGIPSPDRQPMVRYLMARARFRFTLRHYPYFLPTVIVAQLAHCGYDLVRGNVAEVRAALLGAGDAVRGRHRRFPGLGQAELPGRPVEGRGRSRRRRAGAGATARARSGWSG